MISLYLLVYLTIFVSPLFGKRGFTCKEDVHKSICLPENYSKFELPNTGGGNDFDVDIDIDVDVDAQKTHVDEKHHS